MVGSGGDSSDRVSLLRPRRAERIIPVLRVEDPNHFETFVGYDGFGRVAFVRPPPSDVADNCPGDTDVPVQHFLYELTTSPGSSPVSVVRAFQESDCAMLGADTIETRTYVDGLGCAARRVMSG